MGMLRVLCLHGSRQDGEVFRNRLKVLAKKANNVVRRKRCTLLAHKLYCMQASSSKIGLRNGNCALVLKITW